MASMDWISCNEYSRCFAGRRTLTNHLASGTGFFGTMPEAIAYWYTPLSIHFAWDSERLPRLLARWVSTAVTSDVSSFASAVEPTVCFQWRSHTRVYPFAVGAALFSRHHGK